jgi:hypothetical protein
MPSVSAGSPTSGPRAIQPSVGPLESKLPAKTGAAKNRARLSHPSRTAVPLLSAGHSLSRARAAAKTAGVCHIRPEERVMPRLHASTRAKPGASFCRIPL